MKDYLYAQETTTVHQKPAYDRMIIAAFIVLSIPIGYLAGRQTEEY